MTEGTLARWLKKEGDTVKAGDVIAEIETDKATMEVEAVDEGVLGKILVPDGTAGREGERADRGAGRADGESGAGRSGAAPPPRRPRPPPRAAAAAGAAAAAAPAPAPAPAATATTPGDAHLRLPAGAAHGAAGRASTSAR